MSVEEAIAKLKDTDLSDSSLTELSGLDTQQMALFKQTWSTIETEQQRQIADHLVRLADENIELSFDSIFKNLLRDPSAEIRSQAIEGLWECEEPSLVLLLISLLEEDDSVKVQSEAAVALGRFAMLAACGKLGEDDANRIGQALLSTINDKTSPVDIRCFALEAAAPLPLPGVSKAIKENYHSSDDRLSLSSIRAMGTNCDPSWLPTLLSELESADAERRRAAATALGELEEELAVPQLAELLYDPDIDVQMASIEALGEIGGAEAKEYLELCLQDADEDISLAAEEALIDMKDEEDLESFFG
ncbi:MAG: HEAT repeat domain-containing protein [Dehalococcoidales bacterium]|nr:MAG: HEAT repeat domain-containing protein [Dehalococcoidales bacterium]